MPDFASMGPKSSGLGERSGVQEQIPVMDLQDFVT